MTVRSIHLSLFVTIFRLMTCSDFTLTAFQTCKNHRTQPFPTYDANRTNTTVPVSSLNTIEQNRSTSAALPHQKDSLSSGAYAGIGIGTGAFILGLVAAAAFLYRRRNSRKPDQVEEEDITNELDDNGLTEMSTLNEPKELGLETTDFKDIRELDSQQDLKELDSQQDLKELDTHQVHELEAAWHEHPPKKTNDSVRRDT
jgi:hypothetical protein